jgi:hypothetical protein
MSTIGTDYSAHRRSVDDLEQDYDTAMRKAKEREKSREAKLERNLRDTLRKKDAETEESIRDVKDKYENSLRNRTKSDRDERARLKESLYDKNGRRASAIEDSANVDRDRALDAAAAAEAHSAKAISDAERYQERQSDAAESRHEKEMEALVDSYRKQIEEARGDGEGDRESVAEYRKKLSREAQAAIRQAQDEVQAERRQSNAVVEQTNHVLKERDRKSDALLNNRLHEKDLAVRERLNQNAEDARVSRALELQPLREEIMETAGAHKDIARAKNEARAGAIKELESDWNAKYANQTLSHKLETQKLKADTADTERVYGRKFGEYMKENEARTAAKIADQNAAHRDQMTTAANEYDRSLQHLKRQAAHDHELSDRSLARERSLASERQDHLLKTQAETYRATIEHQREAQGSQIKNLQRILNNKNSTSDAGEISAGAEASVRAAVTKEYAKTLKAEADRNARDRDHLAQNYRERLNDAYHDNQNNATTLHRQKVKEQTVLRHEFVQHVDDVEDNKRQMLNHASDANAKMMEMSQRAREREMGAMRRHYEELIASRDTEHANRFEELRSQSEFEKRAMRRDYRAQTADLIRNYDKKLNDQKIADQDQIRDLKGKLDMKTRESDKRLMQALADQARGYDHRMAELEAQAKDRERLASQQHEDELDRVKKANALLLSKKG